MSSNKYHVLYIDDDPSEIREVIRSLERTGELEVKGFPIKGDTPFDEVTALLSQGNFDYLLIDYMLNEKTGWGMNGNEVLEWFLDRYPHFPAIVVTSNEMKALQEVDNIDAEKIRSKNEYDEKEDDSFVTRIISRIKRYHIRIEEAESRLLQLKEKSSTAELNAIEANDYVKYDKFLQETLGGKVIEIPDDIIYRDEGKLNDLLEKTDKLITMIENEKVS